VSYFVTLAVAAQKGWFFDDPSTMLWLWNLATADLISLGIFAGRCVKGVQKKASLSTGLECTVSKFIVGAMVRGLRSCYLRFKRSRRGGVMEHGTDSHSWLRGQGVVTAAELVSMAAFADGKQAQAFPSFGSGTGHGLLPHRRTDDPYLGGGDASQRRDCARPPRCSIGSMSSVDCRLTAMS
jgi:hypothetical protein